MERFLSLLEKNPRRGTALDRVYGYHVERGTLDAFVKTYEARVAKDPNDGVGWIDPRAAGVAAGPGRGGGHRAATGRGHAAGRPDAELLPGAGAASWSASPTRRRAPSSGPSGASRSGTTCSRSSRPSGGSTRGRRRPRRRWPSGAGSRRSSPTTPGSGADRLGAGRGGAGRARPAAVRGAGEDRQGPLPASPVRR